MLGCRDRERLFDEGVPAALEHDRERFPSSTDGDGYQDDIDVRARAQVVESTPNSPSAPDSYCALAVLVAKPRDLDVRDLGQDGRMNFVDDSSSAENTDLDGVRRH